MAARVLLSPVAASSSSNTTAESKFLVVVTTAHSGITFARQHRRLCGGFPSTKVSSFGRPWTSDGQFGVGWSSQSVSSQVETESELLEQLRRSIVSLRKDSGDLDDSELVQFLRAQSLNVDKAAEKVVSHLQWKAAFKPEGHISESEIPDELAMRKSYLQGYTKLGYPLFITFGSKHFPTGDVEQFKRYVVHSLDMAAARAPPEERKLVCIVDLKGLGLKNLDANAFITAFTILQDHYPGFLHKLFMVHVPFIFNGVWKIASPFLDQQTKERVIFVADKKLKETLLSEIDEDQLLVEYGGTASLVSSS